MVRGSAFALMNLTSEGMWHPEPDVDARRVLHQRGNIGFLEAHGGTNRGFLNQPVDNDATVAYLVINQVVDNKEGCVGG